MKKNTTKALVVLSTLLAMTGTALTYAPVASQLEKNMVSQITTQTIPAVTDIVKINSVYVTSPGDPAAVSYYGNVYYWKEAINGDWIYLTNDGSQEIYWDTYDQCWKDASGANISNVTVYRGPAPAQAPK